jgi:hypothetical protein
VDEHEAYQPDEAHEREDAATDAVTAPDTGTATDAQSPLGDMLAPLVTLGDRPLDEHPDVFQQIHASLQGALSEIDGG